MVKIVMIVTEQTMQAGKEYRFSTGKTVKWELDSGPFLPSTFFPGVVVTMAQLQSLLGEHAVVSTAICTIYLAASTRCV
jgi:hypothetical protein